MPATSAPVNTASRPSGSLRGLDILRIAAMGLVVLDHTLSISGSKATTAFGLWNFGGLGVSTFCILSGFLALHASRDGPGRWLARRLNKILLPYWVCLAVVLTANAVIGYKPMSLELIVAEFACVAYFLDPAGMICVPYWFLSLLLVCYAMAAAVRWKRFLLPLCFALTLMLPRFPLPFAFHTLSFLVGVTVALAPKRGIAEGVLGLACLAATATVDVRFAYPLGATVGLLAARLPLGYSSNRLAAISRGTYEFYLVHGPIFLGLAHFAQVPWLANLAVGTVLATAAAWLLHVVVREIRKLLTRTRARAAVSVP
jgi:peptidoglycan/LPS O-acetylase OafA/YrhL